MDPEGPRDYWEEPGAGTWLVWIAVVAIAVLLILRSLGLA